MLSEYPEFEKEQRMDSPSEKQHSLSRRNMLSGSAALLVGGVLGSVMTAYGTTPSSKAPEPTGAPPPRPWKWVKLDPLEAGRRAYRNYAMGGCGYATYKDNDEIYRQIIDRLFYWYAEQDFPTDRFDDIPTIPKQVRVKAMSPLSHTSVSKWTMRAGAQVSSKEKKERCAKVAGEVVYITTFALNEYFDGKWTPPVWKPSKAIEHCVQCHGPDDMFHQSDKVEAMNNQQGHMECLLCHGDHTK